MLNSIESTTTPGCMFVSFTRVAGGISQTFLLELKLQCWKKVDGAVQMVNKFTNV